MIAISIDPQLKKIAPNLVLGAIFANVRVTRISPQLWKEIEKRIKEIRSTITLESLHEIPQIKALRDAYKAIGKDPTRYRGSQESLIRRILQGKGLYQINTVVDINNLISLETFHSVGSYDVDNLEPPIVFRIGKEGESYKGIGKEIVNVADLPVFADQIGPFGSPTSDSERAMITLNTKKVMMVIISFTGKEHIKNQLKRITNLLCNYANASEEGVETRIIE
jgi:DNA/RNA-binding domain of Phe-tRNA-synthetase-like protein